MQDIVTLTMNPSLDLATEVERVKPGQKLRCAPAQRDPGGGGINVARAVHKLGGQALAVYPNGGAAGAQIQTLLDQEQISQSPISIEGIVRENFLVRDQENDQNFRFVLPGPHLSEAEQQKIIDRIDQLEATYLVASGSLPSNVPLDFYARLAQFAQDRQIKLILDTSSSEAVRAACKQGVYLLRNNFHEFCELTGGEPENSMELEERAKQMVDQGGVEMLVITLGSDGALLCDNEKNLQRAKAPPVNVNNPRGAGDSFVAAMVLKLSQKQPPLEALRYAVAAGAAAQLTPGTQLIRHEDVERLYAQISEA
jgi:6-phosphofructokinase 2